MGLPPLDAVSADAREHEVRMLVDLVRLSRVTLLFAESGSDKSGFVRSGVMPLLQHDRGGTVKQVAVLLDWWEKVPLAVLNARIDEALARMVGDAAHAMGDHASADSLCARLAARQRAFDCTFIIIFDRFEEYLAAPADRPDVRDFEAQFVEAVNSGTLAANFLLSLDEDAAPLLARLRERIPGLGDARVRLPKVDAEHAARLPAHPPALADQLVGSRAAAGQRDTSSAQISRHDAPRSRAVEEAGDERQPGIASAREPVGPIADIVPERHDPVAETTVVRARSHAATRAAEASSRSGWRSASIMVAIMVAVLSLLVMLATRHGSGPAPDGATPGATLPAQNDAKAGRDEQAQTDPPARPGDESRLRSEEANATSKGNAGNPIESAASPPAETPSTGTLSHEAVGGSDASKVPAPEKPLASAPPPAQARKAENPRAAASEPAAPLLYINVRSEAQRAYAERLIEPLARHGIRVSGIKVVSAGPPVSDLRYFRSADRAEALRINRALDVVGTPAQHLKYIGGVEEQAPRRQYELWLPPPT
jgi:hypothetical protein